MENDSMTDREPTVSHHSDRWRDAGTGEVGAPAWPSGIHLVATLYFDSLDVIKAGLASPQGRAAAGDLANFADRARSSTFSIQMTLEPGAKYTRASEDVG